MNIHKVHFVFQNSSVQSKVVTCELSPLSGVRHEAGILLYFFHLYSQNCFLN